MRLSILWALTLSWGAADSPAQDYPVPGFDCANISTPQESRICRSPELSELDGRHWHLAARAIRAARDPERTRADVEGWIHHVRDVCETDKCLVEAYRARVAELERSAAKLAPLPLPPQPIAPATPAAENAKPAAAIPAPAALASPAPAAAPAHDEDLDPIWPWLIAAALIALIAALAAFFARKK